MTLSFRTGLNLMARYIILISYIAFFIITTIIVAIVSVFLTRGLVSDSAVVNSVAVVASSSLQNSETSELQESTVSNTTQQTNIASPSIVEPSVSQTTSNTSKKDTTAQQTSTVPPQLNILEPFEKAVRACVVFNTLDMISIFLTPTQALYTSLFKYVQIAPFSLFSMFVLQMLVKIAYVMILLVCIKRVAPNVQVYNVAYQTLTKTLMIYVPFAWMSFLYADIYCDNISTMKSLS